MRFLYAFYFFSLSRSNYLFTIFFSFCGTQFQIANNRIDLISFCNDIIDFLVNFIYFFDREVDE